MLSQQYQWLLKENGPKMLQEALKLYGIKEVVGPIHNAAIISWAKELSIEKIYTNDELAWCGLAMAICAKRAGKDIPMKSWDILRALQWERFGTNVNIPMLGDILIFKRSGGGHVGMYVGEDTSAYHVLGGNQSNQFNIVRIGKDRLYKARRPIYSIGQPSNVRRVFLKSDGKLSQNEA